MSKDVDKSIAKLAEMLPQDDAAFMEAIKEMEQVAKLIGFP